MTKDPRKEEPEPPGGRAAERLRQFEESRKPKKAEDEEPGGEEEGGTEGNG